MVQAPVRTSVFIEFEERFAGSLALHGRSTAVIPGGITHDGRYAKPFPIFVERADGAHKWDVDGHELIDCAMGHGSLILGHSNPEIVAAMQEQLSRGTHYGAGHEREIIWAEQIRSMIPCAEQVRFTASGTEATLLAMRLARAHAGKTTILKFEGHFHGWHDYALKGEKPPFDNPTIPGIPAATLGTVDVLPANDLAAVEARLDQGDIAGIILEPSGASWATIPLAEGFLSGLRDLASAHGSVLIFDEVITGFRWSPGGAQAKYGVTPDLTTLAKVVAGGMPGGAVVGRTSVMQHLAFKDDPDWNKTQKVPHAGTYNANPLAAVAGTTCLRRCADPSVQDACDSLAARMRAGLNATLDRHEAPGFVWGESSVFHISLGANCANRTTGDLSVPEGISATALKASSKNALAGPLQIAMLLEGVDLFSGGGFLTTAHTDADVENTIGAFDRALGRLRDGGLLA